MSESNIKNYISYQKKSIKTLNFCLPRKKKKIFFNQHNVILLYKGRYKHKNSQKKKKSDSIPVKEIDKNPVTFLRYKRSESYISNYIFRHIIV